MHQRIALAVLRIGEISHRADHFAAGGEDDFHGIVEATARHRFQLRAIGPHPPNPRGESFETAAVLGFYIKSVPAIGEIQPPFRPKKWPVQTRRSAHVPTAGEHLARIGFAVAIGIAQPQYIRR